MRSPAAPAPAGPGPRLVKLRNGARLLLAPDPAAAAVDVAAWYEAGVRHERPGLIGISHLLEHLAARAAGGQGDLRRPIEGHGGSNVAFTTPDFVCFTQTVPREALETALRLEAGRMTLVPTQAMLDQDRALVREENRARARANPVERGLQRLYAHAFPGHPYRWPVLGSDEDLARITLRDCQDFLRRRFTPDHAWITVVGNFDAEEALRLARRHIEPIVRRGERTAVAAAPAPGGGRRVVEPGDLPVPLLVVGWQVAAGAAGDAPALDLLASLLVRGTRARIHRRLVAGERSCLFAQAGRDARRDATMFWAVAALRPGSDTAAVERALVEEVERLAEEPASGAELDRARRQVEVASLLSRQTARDRGQALGVAQLLAGDWREAERYLERLRSLTPADLRQAAARTLVGARRTVVWLSPAAEGGGAGDGP